MPVRAITEADIDTPVVTGPQVYDLPGTEKKKSPYTEGQTRDAGFAFRMEQSLRRIESLERSGFDPANFGDLLVDYLGGDEGSGPRAWAERLMLSPKYKQYLRAKMDFSTAQLRKETGAVINDSEIVWINETYFPQLGDGPEVAALKMEARTLAIEAMETEAGEAYKGLSQNEMEALAAKKAKSRAIKILRERAKNNPELADRIRGIIKGIR